MNAIIRSVHGKTTVPAIIREMQEPCEVIQGLRGRYAGMVVDVLIRWGSTTRCQSRRVVNFTVGIQAASRKGYARLTMADAGVAIPPTYIIGGDRHAKVEYPVVVRPQKHRAGKDFYIFDTEEALEDFLDGGDYDEWYVSQLIHKKAEYRVHVAGGRVLVVQKKTARNPGDYDQPIWNHALLGFIFVIVRQNQWRIPVIRQAIAAVDALGLDFGAVDVVLDTDDNPFVLEVNTAPTLEGYVAARYAEYFDDVIREEKRWLPMPEGGEAGFKKNYVFRGD